MSKVFKKIGFFLFLAVIVVFGSVFVAEEMLKTPGGGGLSSSIEAMKIRALKPGMPTEMVQKQAAGAPQGVMGLFKSLSTSKSLTMDAADAVIAGDSQKDRPGATKADPGTLISVSKNRDAILERQTDGTQNPSEVKGAVTTEIVGQLVNVSQTADGREAVAVVRDGSIKDFGDIDRIMAMNISDELRAKILRNYELTGTLPEILVREKRKPATPSAGDSNDPNDPYSKKNW